MKGHSSIYATGSFCARLRLRRPCWPVLGACRIPLGWLGSQTPHFHQPGPASPTPQFYWPTISFHWPDHSLLLATPQLAQTHTSFGKTSHLHGMGPTGSGPSPLLATSLTSMRLVRQCLTPSGHIPHFLHCSSKPLVKTIHRNSTSPKPWEGPPQLANPPNE